MSDWKEYKLGNIINLKRGYDLPNSKREKGKYPIYSSSGITDFHDEFMKKAPGVITGRYGTIGEVFYSNTEYWPLNTTLYVQDFKGNNPKYIYYFLKNFDFEKYNDKSAVPGINRNHVHEENVLIPDVPEQIMIARFLSSLDDKIDLLQRQNKTLEQLAETLFRQWFVEEANEQSEDFFMLGDLIESVSITHKFPNNQVVFLNTSDIFLGEVLTHELSDIKSLPGQAKKSIKNDDILFSEIRPANGRYAYIDFAADTFVVSTKLMVLRSKKIVPQPFVYFYLTHPQTVEWLQVLAESRSGTFPQITFDQLRDLKINIPSKDIFEQAIIWCEHTLTKIKANHKQIKTLIQLRDTSLPKLMSGEIRVL